MADTERKGARGTLQRAGRLEPSCGLPARAESQPSKRLRDEPPDRLSDRCHTQSASRAIGKPGNGILGSCHGFFEEPIKHPKAEGPAVRDLPPPQGIDPRLQLYQSISNLSPNFSSRTLYHQGEVKNKSV